MGNVYRVESLYGNQCEYFNTAKEADRCKPGGEWPESVVRVDAAGECNRLARDVDAADRLARSVRLLLEQLWDVCSVDDVGGTEIGRRVNKFIEENPLSPATNADREGQRSYGT